MPLAVWPVAQTSAQYQRAGRYLPGCAEHPAKMLPELARRIVAEYSSPGALVVDVMAGIATTVVEAALLGRRAIGVEVEPRWAALATANLDHMLDPGQRHLAEVRVGDARRLGDVAGDLTGTVDLVCTSPPYACDVGNMDKTNWGAGGDLCPTDTRNYSTDKDNLGHARGAAYEQAMAEIYAGCHALLRPGGILVTVTKHTRRGGRTLDLAGLTSTLARGAGFAYLGHVVALHAAIRDGDLVARPSFWQTTQVRKARARGEPAHVVVHEDLLAFYKAAADAH
ncbi:MAG: DNA methyltransferase [Actinomycetota bacterium]|nr:DNA methyltransferase [Actinomycetota bacterium]